MGYESVEVERNLQYQCVYVCLISFPSICPSISYGKTFRIHPLGPNSLDATCHILDLKIPTSTPKRVPFCLGLPKTLQTAPLVALGISSSGLRGLPVLKSPVTSRA